MIVAELPNRIEKNIEHFTGRLWLLSPVLNWLENTSDQLFMITGEPGTGKSMIAAWLAGAGPSPADTEAGVRLEQIRSRVKAAHFCLAASGNTAPKAFAQSLAEQLTRTVPGFGAALAATLDERVRIVSEQRVGVIESGGSATGIYIEHLDLGDLGDELSFDRALRDPLIKLYRGDYKEPMLLVADALDEALAYTGAINIVQILARLTDLPAPIRFMVTTRPDPRVLYLHHIVKPFDLIEDAPENIDDVRTYASEQLRALPPPDRAALGRRIAAAAEGNFLYAHLVLEDLRPRLSSLDNVQSLPLPKGLSGLYSDFLNRGIGTDRPRWLNSVRPVLGLVAVAQGAGLTRTQIEGMTKQDVEATLESWKQYLDGALPDGPFRPFHKSFADFLLEDKENKAYHVDAARAHQQVVEFYWPSQNGAAPWTGWDDYGLRYLATHLAQSARGRPAREAYPIAERLVRLAVNPEFQNVHKAQVDNLAALQADLGQALRTVAAQPDPRALPLVMEAALALVAFRREELRPEPLFDLARRGEVEAAARRIDLFEVEQYWKQAALLTIAWLAAGARPDRARQLRDRIIPEISTSGPLYWLLDRLNAALDNTPIQLASLPYAPPEDVARALVARMDGSGADVELLARNSYATQLMPTEGLGTSGYLAQEDGPPLVAFAVANPQIGNELFQRYLATHTGYSYVQYRNRSLWYLMDAVLRHPNSDWVLATTCQMVIAALAGSRLDYEEGAGLAIRAMQAMDGNTGSLQELEAYAARALKESRLLGSGPASGWFAGTGPGTEAAEVETQRGQGDTWGMSKRRLSALAQTYALILNRFGEATMMLDQALAVLRSGFAGFGSAACLTLAESIHIVAPDWKNQIHLALDAARTAAHNIQDATFCARITARYNAYGTRWWGLATDELVMAARRLTQDSSTPEFAALHRVGEEYGGRTGPGLPRPEWPGHAQSLQQLSDLYHRPLADFLQLNREAGWAADDQLPLGTLVNIPDPGFATLLAALFSARILTATTLPKDERVQLLQLLVPVAASNPTALDTVLTRLLLAAHPSDPDILNRLAQLAERAGAEAWTDSSTPLPPGIPS